MFEQSFKDIDDILRKDAGCSSELDYIEQTSWILFLRYLDSLEHTKIKAAALADEKYTNIILKDFQWAVWACPKKNDKLDYNEARTGDDLIAFVNQSLFPYLKKFKTKSYNYNTTEYKIGGVFGRSVRLST